MDIINPKKTNRKSFINSLTAEEAVFRPIRKKNYDCRAYVFGAETDIDELERRQKSNIEEGITANDFLSLDQDYGREDFTEDEIEFGKDGYMQFEETSGEERNGGIEIKEKGSSFLFAKATLAAAIFLVALAGAGFFFMGRSLDIKEQVMGISDEALGNVDMAVANMKESNFSLSSDKFGQAYENFSNMADSLNDLGSAVISVSRFIPGASQLSSGYELTQAGKHLSSAGKKISEVAQDLDDLKKNSINLGEEDMNALNIFRSFERDISDIKNDLDKAQESLEKVKLGDIPDDKREGVKELKLKLPIIIQGVDKFSQNSHIIADLLGANGPRKYLFLFQNNQEMRATGGFIGSYGLLDIEDSGRIRNFFIDGIFNPDGQLVEKIVPPKPIQKISAAWSLHDSNWFPDFPLSAQKAISFYEKTGGPTVDGVVTLTPTVMQELLKITGPIYMEEYDTELNGENFIQNIQYEVEEDYDKEENRPKKILSDLAPIVLDKLFSSNDAKVIARTAEVLQKALSEKHILIYSSNPDLQKIISDVGWSGEILDTSRDYLSIINSNINGYKTDGIVDETIKYQAEIQEDGTIIDTVTIIRKHNGGNEEYDWWNKVNANYMRVYVPEGSELLEVEGQTREFNDSPLDYDSLNFTRDADVGKEESEMQINELTGTRTYFEKGKTVFANWVYVSPQEEVVVRYKYKLPFKASMNFEKPFSSFSLLAQKQSGSLGSDFELKIEYPEGWKTEWTTENMGEGLGVSTDLSRDKFFGAVFVKKQD